MPSRNKRREMQKFGEVKDHADPVQEHVVVTPEDLQRLKGLSAWTLKYVDYIYEHAGINGTPKPKNMFDRPINWRHGRFGETGSFTVSSRERRWDSVGGFVDEELYRPRKDGIHLAITHTLAHGAPSTREHGILNLDANGLIVDGDYGWFGPPGAIRLAPDAEFDLAEGAHEATVSGRLGFLLGHLHELVTDPHSRVKLENVSNLDLGVMPPVELIPIPEVA